MTIDMLDRKTILVTLQSEDLRRYAPGLLSQTDPDATRRGLTELLIRVGEEFGLDHRGRSYLVEALPARDCCLLIISVRRSRRKKYRIKRETTRTVCVFDTADAMLDWMNSPLYKSFGYAVYQYHDRYILTLDSPVSPYSLGALSEYGRVASVSAVVTARIQEHGKLQKEHHTVRRYAPAKSVSSAAI